MPCWTSAIYAEFAALPTASGLVITPYTDDLVITVAGTRVRIARPGGLSLTPPQIAIGETPAGAWRRPPMSPVSLTLPLGAS